MDAKLSFDVLKAFHQRYVEGEKATEILKDMGRTDLVPSQVMKAFPPYPVEGACPLCGGARQCRWLSRTEYTCGGVVVPFCVNCGHREEVRCSCEQCRRERAEEHERQLAAGRAARAARLTALKTWIAGQPPRSLAHAHECDPRCLLALAADLYAKAVRSREPTESRVWSAYRQLGVANGWRIPDVTGASADAFDESGQVIEDLRALAAYRWNVDAQVTYQDVCDVVCQRLAGDNELLKEIWLDIMAEECLVFLESRLKQMRLPTGRLMRPIYSVLVRLLAEVPASLVCRFIWLSMRDAATYALEQTANSQFRAVGRISDRLEHHYRMHRSGKYVGASFSRSAGYERTALNRMYFSEVLEGIGDIGFEECVVGYLPRTPLWRRDVAEGASSRPVCCDCGALEVIYEQRRSTIRLECQACGQVQIFEADPMTP